MAGLLSLTDHLRAGARAPFAWGACDCCLWPADWMLARRGVDPAAPLRGRYRTALGALRHIRRLGGFDAMVRGLMAEAGFAETQAPRPGDVGVVETPAGLGLAVRTTHGWAGKGEAGIVVASYPCRVAWRI